MSTSLLKYVYIFYAGTLQQWLWLHTEVYSEFLILPLKRKYENKTILNTCKYMFVSLLIYFDAHPWID